jgi:PAS domain-containing protein
MLILPVLNHECSTICRFSLALFEAVDQCNDAVQITGKDSTIMVSAVTVSDFKLGGDYHIFFHFPYIKYVNRSFLDLSGYTRDEVIGKPAMDILKPFDKTVSVINPLNLERVRVSGTCS